MSRDDDLKKWLGQVARRGPKALSGGYPITVGRLFAIASTILGDKRLAREATGATYRYILENAKDLRGSEKPFDQIMAACRRISLDRLDQSNMNRSRQELKRLTTHFKSAPEGCEGQHLVWISDRTNQTERDAFLITFFLAFNQSHFDEYFTGQQFRPLLLLEDFVKLISTVYGDGGDDGDVVAHMDFEKKVIHRALGLEARHGESDPDKEERERLELHLAPMLAFLPEQIPDPAIILDGDEPATSAKTEEASDPPISALGPASDPTPDARPDQTLAARRGPETPGDDVVTAPIPTELQKLRFWKRTAIAASCLAALSVSGGAYLSMSNSGGATGDVTKGAIVGAGATTDGTTTTVRGSTPAKTGADLFGVAASQGAGSFVVLIESRRGRLRVYPVGIQALESDRLLLWLETTGEAPKLAGRVAIAGEKLFRVDAPGAGDRMFITLENENAAGDTPSAPGGPRLYNGVINSALD